jgi:hypothetical protein
MNDRESDSIEQLRESIDRLSEYLSKYVSFRMTFARGIIYGLGTALGATIIAAIVVWIIINLFEPIIPGVENISNVLNSIDSGRVNQGME